MRAQRIWLYGPTIVCALLVPGRSRSQQPSSPNWVSIISQYARAIVLIRTEVNGKLDYGSGVVFDRSGLVLTARHIIPANGDLTAGNSEIKGLVGEQSASHDFGAASVLTPVFVSDRYDVAVLKFASPPPNIVAAPASTAVKQGEALLILGYPGGGALIATDGLASGNAEDDMYSTNAVVGRGNSGGPVFNAQGQFLGLLLQGSGYDPTGNIKLGYFRRNGTIMKILEADPPKIGFRDQTGAVSNIPASGTLSRNPATIRVNYTIDATNDNHPVVLGNYSRDYTAVFSAQANYRIASAEFKAESVNHLVSGPSIEKLDGGARVIMRWTLESGPAVDRWRGWLHGRLETTQANMKE